MALHENPLPRRTRLVKSSGWTANKIALSAEGNFRTGVKGKGKAFCENFVVLLLLFVSEGTGPGANLVCARLADPLSLSCLFASFKIV